MRDRLQDPSIQTIQDLALSLKKDRCIRCRLGSQPGLLQHVVYRGNPQSSLFWIAEAPGLEEMKTGEPFRGPAGRLLDRMVTAMKLQEECCYTNVSFCRPIAAPGSGKQNDTPTLEELAACRPYISWVLRQHRPRVAILLGKPAATSILPRVAVTALKNVIHKFYLSDEFPDTLFTIMYHPAYLLRQEHMSTYPQLKKVIWDHLLQIKKVLEEEND